MGNCQHASLRPSFCPCNSLTWTFKPPWFSKSILVAHFCPICSYLELWNLPSIECSSNERVFWPEDYCNIFCLPFNLLLKTSDNLILVEAEALHFVESLKGINTPALTDSCSAPQKACIILKWIEGDCCADVLEKLAPLEKEKNVEKIRSQYSALVGLGMEISVESYYFFSSGSRRKCGLL